MAGLYEHGLRDDGLIAHWPLDEPAGSTIVNPKVGSAVGFASAGVVTSASGGQVGGAATFDGVNDCIGMPFTPADMAGNFTVAFWININNNFDFKRLFYIDDFFQIAYHDGADKLAFEKVGTPEIDGHTTASLFWETMYGSIWLSSGITAA